jgi:hypothetical protein
MPRGAAQTAAIAAAKRVIHDGFQSALTAGVPKEKAGILMDEQFGAAILPARCRSRGYRAPAAGVIACAGI